MRRDPELYASRQRLHRITKYRSDETNARFGGEKRHALRRQD